MADLGNYVLPAPPILTPFAHENLGGFALAANSSFFAAVSDVWTARVAYFYPVVLTDWATARQLLFWVGAVSAGNIDVGIYDAEKHLIVSSGSTPMSAVVNTVQELNIPDTPLAPGRYLLAAVSDSTTGTCFRAEPAQGDELFLSGAVVYDQPSGFPLPDPCTPVVTTEVIPPIKVIGIQLSPTF